MQYDEIRNYGFNIIMKDYARFPRFLPAPCYIDHGWTTLSETAPDDLNNDKPFTMVFSKRMAEAWKRQSTKPVVIMGSPCIHYKNSHNIKKKKDAKGTVVFPSHSTYFLKSQFSIKDYCLELKKLPKEFHPITICLFWLDFIDPSADIYREMGFSVVTAGYRITNSLDFVKNFYRILSSHKYATSNDVGSYLFYAVDLGIPFFLTGESPVLYNKGNRDVNLGEYTSLQDFPYGKITRELFSTGPVKKITEEQKKFVIDEMGINDCISSEKMNNIFWLYYNKNHYWFRAFVPYLIASLWAMLLFNLPFIKILISARKKMLK